MGTILQRSIDLLAILPNNKAIYAIYYSYSWKFVKKKFSEIRTSITDQFLEFMDRKLEQFSREFLRMTMLKHDEIFKEQVRELHRLYKVQKMLMAELRNNESKLLLPTSPNRPATRVGTKFTVTDCPTTFLSTRTTSDCPNTPATRAGTKFIVTDCPNTFWSTGTTSVTNQLPITTNSGYYIQELYGLRVNSNSREQSSTCTGDISRMHKGFDLERPAEEDISATEDQGNLKSLRSLKEEVNVANSHPQTDGDSDVELTLSIGFGASKKQPKKQQPYSSVHSSSNEKTQIDPLMSIRSDQREECSDPTNISTTLDAAFGRESLQKPPWLFRTLSLNRT